MKTIDEFICNDQNAPERLKGRIIKLIIDPNNNKIEFQMDMPDDATPNELAYFSYNCSELADKVGIDTSTMKMYKM